MRKFAFIILGLFLVSISSCTLTPDREAPAVEEVCDSKSQAADGPGKANINGKDCYSDETKDSYKACDRVGNQNASGTTPCVVVACPCFETTVLYPKSGSAPQCDSPPKSSNFYYKSSSSIVEISLLEKTTHDGFVCVYQSFSSQGSKWKLTPAQYEACKDLLIAACSSWPKED